jgi:hypothetical protein
MKRQIDELTTLDGTIRHIIIELVAHGDAEFHCDCFILNDLE